MFICKALALKELVPIKPWKVFLKCSWSKHKGQNLQNIATLASLLKMLLCCMQVASYELVFLPLLPGDDIINNSLPIICCAC